MDELIDCVSQLREKTKLKLYVTTSVPKVCYDNYDKFIKLIDMLDGTNLSVQHYKEDVADEINILSAVIDNLKDWAEKGGLDA